MSFKRVLVVEDDADIRTLVTLALELEGYEVLNAENGLRALELLRSLPEGELPCCMLLDLMMPLIDGKTLLATLAREHPAFLGRMKVIIATAKGSPLNPTQIPAGADRIQKPFELEELYRIVERHCGKPG